MLDDKALVLLGHDPTIMVEEAPPLSHGHKIQTKSDEHSARYCSGECYTIFDLHLNFSSSPAGDVASEELKVSSYLFPLLLPVLDLKKIFSHPAYETLSHWAKSAYSSFASILCVDESGPVVIGSATLVFPNAVATAKALVSGYRKNNLFIRFHRYEVNLLSKDRLLVKEDYLELPVIHKHGLEGSSGIAYLYFPNIGSTLLSRYAQRLPTARRLLSDTLSDYAVFYFKDSLPSVAAAIFSSEQVAIHSSSSVLGSSLVSMREPIEAYAVFISYNSYDEKAPTQFIELFPHLSMAEKLLLPYTVSEELQLYRKPKALTEVMHQPLAGPYRVGPYHVNHFIIPMASLIYLYDYFFTLDKATHSKFLSQSITKAREWAREQTVSLEASLTSLARDIAMDQIRVQQSEKQKQCLAELTRKELDKRYGVFHERFILLSPDNKPGKEWFVWSFWNLFQGWDAAHRKDHPVSAARELSSIDSSEKIKPKGFPIELWGYLKDPDIGLYSAICLLREENLKEATSDDEGTFKRASAECVVLNALSGIHRFWCKQEPRIYPYDPSDWSCHGKGQYCLDVEVCEIGGSGSRRSLFA